MDMGTSPTWGRRAVAVALAVLLLAALLAVSVTGVNGRFSDSQAVGGNAFTTAASFPSSCTTTTVTATTDSYVDQSLPGSNYGSVTTLGIRSQSGANRRTLVRFDLPALPSGCTLTSASLELTDTSGSTGRTLAAYRAAAAWTEAGVTWSNQPATAGNPSYASTDCSPFTFEVTHTVKLWYGIGDASGGTGTCGAPGAAGESGTSAPNHGFLVRDNSEDAAGSAQTIASREYSFPAWRPSLVLTFQDATYAGYSQAVLDDGPVAYYPLGESSGTNAADASGSGLDGAYVGGPLLGRPGAFSADTAVQFQDGVADHMAVPHDSALDVDDVFSIEMWVKRSLANPSGPDQTMICKQAGGFCVSWKNDSISLHTDTTDVTTGSFTGSNDTSAFHHLVVTKNGSTVKFYWDGQGIYSVSNSLIADMFTTTTGPLYVGAADGAADTTPFPGTLDEVAVYGYTLTDAQVSAHYNAN